MAEPEEVDLGEEEIDLGEEEIDLGEEEIDLGEETPAVSLTPSWYESGDDYRPFCDDVVADTYVSEIDPEAAQEVEDTGLYGPPPYHQPEGEDQL